MKKIICFLCIAGSMSFVNAQAKKEKKFVEIQNMVSYTNSRTVDLQNKYYTETKNSILQNEKKLGENDLNKMLIFNQEEFYRSIKYSSSSPYMDSQNIKSANEVYATNLSSKLDIYKQTVLEKLNSLLANK